MPPQTGLINMQFNDRRLVVVVVTPCHTTVDVAVFYYYCILLCYIITIWTFRLEDYCLCLCV